MPPTREYVVPHLIEFDPQLREAFLTVEDYLARLQQAVADAGSGGGPGTSDHHLLTNLTVGDDHPQYLKPSEVTAGANITVTNNGDGTITVSGPAVPTVPAVLDDLTDVNTLGETTGTVLQFDSATGLWTPQVILLDYLADVNVTAAPPDDGDVLAWDVASQQWIPANPFGSIEWDQVLAAEVLSTDGSGKARTWYGPSPNPTAPSDGDVFMCTLHSATPVVPPAIPVGVPTVTVT